MALSRQQVRRIAALARLDLEPGEEELFACQLGRIVDYFDHLGEFEAAAAPGGLGAGPEPFEADDVPAACLPREAFLDNAPETFEGFLLVPRVKVTRPKLP